jgi:flagellar biosynthesis/type III secretory pathway protein FliH
MLQELLARVLVGGIGRLYFECHPQYGRVLWSQDGILQSVLEYLPLPAFQQLLQELKQIAQASPPTPSPYQVEIERLYDRHRVLLRFRFMVGKHGEEATLQVLRGAALRFHQKQQLSTLKRDALGIAKQLQTKLNEIRDRAYAEPGLAAARFEALPALNQLLQNIEEQLNGLENAVEGQDKG